MKDYFFSSSSLISLPPSSPHWSPAKHLRWVWPRTLQTSLAQLSKVALTPCLWFDCWTWAQKHTLYRETVAVNKQDSAQPHGQVPEQGGSPHVLLPAPNLSLLPELPVSGRGLSCHSLALD